MKIDDEVRVRGSRLKYTVIAIYEEFVWLKVAFGPYNDANSYKEYMNTREHQLFKKESIIT